MRAINLVPAESRPGRVSGGKSGGAVYGVLGALVVMILAATVFAQAKRDEARAQADLAAVQQSTEAYSRAATEYASFEEAAKQANQRIATVRALADARFDWAGTLRDLSRLVPETTRIGALTASVSTSATGTSGGASSALRGALPAPAIAMSGCAMSQGSVALLVNQLQAMRRVTNVSLESSKQANGAGGGSSEDDAAAQFEQTTCDTFEFNLVIFFAPGDALASADAGAKGSTTTVSTESAGGTAPTTPGTSSSEDN